MFSRTFHLLLILGLLPQAPVLAKPQSAIQKQAACIHSLISSFRDETIQTFQNPGHVEWEGEGSKKLVCFAGQYRDKNGVFLMDPTQDGPTFFELPEPSSTGRVFGNFDLSSHSLGRLHAHVSVWNGKFGPNCYVEAQKQKSVSSSPEVRASEERFPQLRGEDGVITTGAYAALSNTVRDLANRYVMEYEFRDLVESEAGSGVIAQCLEAFPAPGNTAVRQALEGLKGDALAQVNRFDRFDADYLVPIRQRIRQETKQKGLSHQIGDAPPSARERAQIVP